MKKIILFFVVNFSLTLFCQERLDLDYLASKYALSSFEGFKKLLSIPNDANDKIGIEKNIKWTEGEFGKRGFTVSKIMTKGAPLLLAKRDFTSKGKTVLCVHHDLATVSRYFDYLVLLNMRVVASGPTSETFTRENLQKTYGGKLNLLDDVAQALKNVGRS